MNVNSPNVDNVCAVKELCTGCQMCSAVCCHNAIQISLNDEGFYSPIVDDSLCVGCGLCINVCAKYDSAIIKTTEDQLADTQLYAAKAKDINILKTTTSGGVADILAKCFIEQGYKVVGVRYNSINNKAEHKIACTIGETDEFRGSKYIQSYTVEAFQYVVKHAKQEKIALFGLPCQIYAMDRYLNRRGVRDNCILIDMFCHGCPSMLVWDKVSSDLKKRMNTEIFSSVKWRSKSRGWGRFLLEITSVEGKIYKSSPSDNAFYEFFFSNQLLKASCKECKFRSTLAYADIRLGDFWGKAYKTNTKGVSAISVISKRGKNVMELIWDHIDCEQKKYEDFLPYQSWGHSYIVDKQLRQELLMLLKNHSTSVDDCLEPLKRRYSLLKRIKILVKNILSYLPICVEKQISNLFV